MWKDLLRLLKVILLGGTNESIESLKSIRGNLQQGILGGTINKVKELASTLQVCFDAGTKKVLLPMASAVEISTVPQELFAKFQISFYQSPEDAVFKALGVE